MRLVTAPTVINALKAALDAAPDDDAIRRHLADLLVAEGRAAEALGYYEESLRTHSDDTDLRRAAALAARLCGRAEDAESHERAAGGSIDTGNIQGALALADGVVDSTDARRDGIPAAHSC